MEPTIMQGDGYLLVPAGSAESGDILTFYSDERDEYVTHRVVGVTEDGYVTQGDNNPSTDQASGYPLVSGDSVLGRVATVGGHPLVLPQFGTALTTLRTHWAVGLGVVALLSLFSGSAARRRDVVRFRSLLAPLVVMLVLSTSTAFVIGPPASSVTFEVGGSGSTGERTVPVGASAVRTVEAEIGDSPAYTHQFIDANGMAIRSIDRTERADRLEVRVPAQTEPGPYRADLTVYQYPASLPYGVVAPLHALHPAIGALASMTALIAPLYLLVWFLVDGKEPLQTHSRRRSLRGRLK